MLSIRGGAIMPVTPSPGGAFPLLVAEIFEAAGILRRYGEHIAGAAGQTQARWQLMSAVSEGDWTVPAAASRLGVSRQAVQRIANELVSEGLASFRANPRHHRSPFLHLTGRGRDTLAAITIRADADHLELSPELAGLDLSRIHSDLRRLTQAVRSQLGPGNPDDSNPGHDGGRKPAAIRAAASSRAGPGHLG